MLNISVPTMLAQEETAILVCSWRLVASLGLHCCRVFPSPQA